MMKAQGTFKVEQTNLKKKELIKVNHKETIGLNNRLNIFKENL